MKKLILLLTAITTLTYAAGPDVGSYLLVQEGEKDLHCVKFYEATVYVENGSKMILLKGYMNTPLKIEFENKDTFTAVAIPENGIGHANMLLYIFKGFKQSEDVDAWICAYSKVHRASPGVMSKSFLLIPKAIEVDNSETN